MASRWWGAAYIIISILPVAIVVAVPYLVLQDGGLHLSSAAAFEGLLVGRWPEYLAWRPMVPPNLTVEILMLGLVQVVSADWALRLVTILIVLSFAAAAALLVRSAGAPLGAAALLLPFAFNYPLMLGLLGFAAAVPLAIVAIAFVLKNPLNPRPIPLAVLLLLTWFTHLMPALLASVAVATIVWIAHFTTIDRSLVRRILITTVNAFRKLFVPLLPTMALTAWFLYASRTMVAVDGDDSRAAPLKHLIGMTWSTVSYAYAEYWIFRLLALAFYIAAALILLVRIRHRSGLRPIDGLLVTAVLATVASAVISDVSSSGAVYVNARLSLFGPLLLAGWLAGHLSGPHVDTRTALKPGGVAVRRLLVLCCVLAALVALVLPLVRWPALRDLGHDVQEFRSLARFLPEKCTLIQLNFDDGRSDIGRIVPLANQSGALAVERHCLSLDNESGWYPYYPWRYTDSARADIHLAAGPSEFGTVPPRLRFGAALSTGYPLSAVVVVGRAQADRALLESPPARAVQLDLESEFHKVATSSDGLAELWLRE